VSASGIVTDRPAPKETVVFYFQHHVGDYRRDTGHLTLLEHGIYRQLIDLYYITEKPLDASAMRLVCVRTADEEQAYKRVLADFFHERKGKYFHKRCDFEISKYKDKSSKATDSAKTRWNKIKDLPDANALQTHCDDDADGMLTKEPINLTTKEPNNLQTKEPKNLTKANSTTRRQAACVFQKAFQRLFGKTFCLPEKPNSHKPHLQELQSKLTLQVLVWKLLCRNVALVAGSRLKPIGYLKTRAKAKHQTTMIILKKPVS
jgi:uncharacterized protein YdaU (DUF1376 family)